MGAGNKWDQEESTLIPGAGPSQLERPFELVVQFPGLERREGLCPRSHSLLLENLGP